MMQDRLLVIGVGNAERGDDGAGMAVVEALQRMLPSGVEVRAMGGNGTRLMEAWAEAKALWVVDAVRAGGAPGTIYRYEAHTEPLPVRAFATSTHTFGLAEAVEVARALGRLPKRLVVYGIEAATFELGTSVSAAVQQAATEVAQRIQTEVEATLASQDG